MSQYAQGTQFGQYIIERYVASGHHAEIYCARDKHGKQVALKILHAHHNLDSEELTRFWFDASAAHHLKNHPHIVPVLAADHAHGRYYIVMPFKSGLSFDKLMDDHAKWRLKSLSGVLALMQQVATAIDYAHQNGIVHRDINPRNILLSHDYSQAFLTDFGIAHALHAKRRITTPGEVLGTAAYMAPEQIRGKKPQRATDVYGFGATLFHVLTGREPFVGEAPAVMNKHLRESLERASSINPALPPAVDAILRKAMHKRPHRRYRSATAVVNALQRATQRQGTQPGGKRGISAATMSLVLTTVLVALVYLGWHMVSTSTAPTPPPTLAVATTPASPPPTPTAPTSAAEPTVTLAVGSQPPAGETTQAPNQSATLPTSVDGVGSSGTTCLEQSAQFKQHAPAQSVQIPADRTQLVFRWSWIGAPLASGCRFRLRFHTPGQAYQQPFPPTAETQQEINLAQLNGNGPWEWSVVLVDVNNPERRLAESYRWTLQWER